MLLEADIFNPSNTLPDVSKSVVLPQGVSSSSALAGINSGKDYAEAIKNAAYNPLEERAKLKREILSELDQDPTKSLVNKSAVERKNLARELRSSLGGRPRPDATGGSYALPSYNTPATPPMPGTEDTPVASSGEEGNILGQPPPPESVIPYDDTLFPAAPDNTEGAPPLLLPPPVAPTPSWNPADIFKNLY